MKYLLISLLSLSSFAKDTVFKVGDCVSQTRAEFIAPIDAYKLIKKGNFNFLARFYAYGNYRHDEEVIIEKLSLYEYKKIDCKLLKE